jgi:CRISPR/Cas system-associated exonuclease Cas4 (RecB family)
MKIIRSSEIGAYLYCQRAWWYQRQGVPSENQAELAGGTALHERHGRMVATTGCLRSVAYALLLAALALLTIYLSKQFL